MVRVVCWTPTSILMRDIHAFVKPGSGRINISGTVSTDALEAIETAVNAFNRDDLLRSTDVVLSLPTERVQGRSIAVAIYIALHDAMTRTDRGDRFAVTGDLTDDGKLVAVDAVSDKVRGAVYAGADTILVPFDNINDIACSYGIKIYALNSIYEALKVLDVSSFLQIRG